MTLTGRYLKAVAAQLPRADRDDITAELQDAIETRMEARAADLGRPLTDADEEAVLREMGHPLSVAGRYGSGPHHIVGPDLYPWWMFGVKVSLMIMAVVTLTVAVIRTLVGDVDVSQAIGQTISSLISSGITLIGIATVTGYILERQKVRPDFMVKWRVKDLGLFEMAGMDTDALARGVGGSLGKPAAGQSYRMSPTARALASAVGCVVGLLWWIGLLPIGVIRVEEFGTAINGIDYGLIFRQLVDALYWPVIVWFVARIAFDLYRAARPEAVRMTAAGDLIFGAVQVTLSVWLWQSSPLSPLIQVDSVQTFVERVGNAFQGGDWSLATILMVVVAWSLIATLFTMSGALARLVTGRTPGRD